MKRIIAKFGGTSLESGEFIRKAAKSVQREFERGTQIVVVVSAVGDTTDRLVEDSKVSTNGKVSPKELDSIMAMGERTSSQIFASSLRSLGLKAREIDPKGSDWPIITDSNFGNATPNLEVTEGLIKKRVFPLLEKGVIPVIPGFVGRDEEGNITTLGRGASDVTAFLVGKCLDADEVIVVTDAEGVMSADPRMVEGPILLERITAMELCDLAMYGARILHRRALNYKEPDISAKIIHFKHGDLNAKGTVVEGTTQGDRGMSVSLHPDPLAMLTVVGEGMQTKPGVLVSAIGPLSEAGINIFGVSIGPRSFSTYIKEEESKRSIEILRGSVEEDGVMKSVASRGGIAMLVAESEEFIETPGIVARLSDPLAEEGINIIEIYSSQASISFFVDWEDRERALKSIEEVMEEMEL